MHMTCLAGFLFYATEAGQNFSLFIKQARKLHFHAPIGALVTEALVTRYSKGEVTLKRHLWTLDHCSHARLERNTNSNRILVICHELLTNSKKVNSSLQHFCPHARRLGFSFAILKARYSFRLYIHIYIPENKTKMVFIYWFIWFVHIENDANSLYYCIWSKMMM